MPASRAPDTRRGRGAYIDSPQALYVLWGWAYIYKSQGEICPYEMSTLGRVGGGGGTGEGRDVKY
ncbi:type II secretion system protein GspG [Pannonibacter phragmitetus]|uniref:type II secretion system protein GspG n=1 Tax=Pannonibacter phragmitetus TaxID=121719 RepID=UPI000E672FEF